MLICQNYCTFSYFLLALKCSNSIYVNFGTTVYHLLIFFYIVTSSCFDFLNVFGTLFLRNVAYK